MCPNNGINVILSVSYHPWSQNVSLHVIRPDVWTTTPPLHTPAVGQPCQSTRMGLMGCKLWIKFCYGKNFILERRGERFRTVFRIRCCGRAGPLISPPKKLPATIPKPIRENWLGQPVGFEGNQLPMSLDFKDIKTKSGNNKIWLFFEGWGCGACGGGAMLLFY